MKPAWFPDYDRKHCLTSDKQRIIVDVDVYGFVVGPDIKAVRPFIGKPFIKLVHYMAPQGNFDLTKFEAKRN